MLFDRCCLLTIVLLFIKTNARKVVLAVRIKDKQNCPQQTQVGTCLSPLNPAILGGSIDRVFAFDYNCGFDSDRGWWWFL